MVNLRNETGANGSFQHDVKGHLIRAETGEGLKKHNPFKISEGQSTPLTNIYFSELNLALVTKI